mmetsp:Transcript_77978/g.215635  ORF Transcript_77978/g.215635 Transcript_77978/m.215635 type:complete len:225 (-) Transcript_77978:139-813(-)
MVAPGPHDHLGAGALQHEACPDEVAALHRLVAHLLQGDGLLAAKALVSRDDDGALGIDHAVPEGARGEAGKDHGVHAANPGRGQHHVRRLRDHGHVHRDAIPLPGTVELVQICDPARLLQQLLETDLAHICGFIALIDDGCSVWCDLRPAVHAIVANVQLSSGEPADVARVHILEEDLAEGPHPAQGLCLLRPEVLSLRANRALVHLVVLLHVGHVAAMSACWW